MRRYGIILYVSLLVIPALIAGMALYRWLRLEQLQVDRSVEAAAGEQVRAVADTMILTVEDTTDVLLRSLAEFTPDDVTVDLPRWNNENPLIRNVFVWRENEGLIIPDMKWPTGEERMFAARYDALFRDSKRWLEAVPDQAPATYESSRVQLRRSVKKAPSLLSDKEQAGRGGWIRWLTDNDVHLLGWSEFPDGSRYGIELETVALISRLSGLLPASMPPGQTMALVDAGGRMVSQRGEVEATPGMPRVATAYLAAVLPHWELVIYRTGEGLAASGRRTGRLLAGMLAAIFVVAPLSGGALLLWQSQRDARDARRKTTFVSNVSHELKTPLTTIRMYAEMLAEGRVKDENKRAGYLDTIVRESQRLTRLVNNVLDFGRLEQGRKRYTPQAFDAAEAAGVVLREQLPRLQDANMTLESELSGPCEVWMDRDAFEQTLLNLVDNAIKYAAPGRCLRVVLSGRTLKVADEGPGIPRALREKIFDRFYRVDESLTARQPGSGLGLTIARRLMRDQGGDVSCDAVDSGACFVVHLPGPNQNQQG